MEILIIGSKGFIGSNALRYFQSISENHVFGCDVMVDYNEPDYFLLDAADNSFNDLFEQHQFDVCINCSGAASVPDSMCHPLRDFLLNTSNVYQILDAIRRFNPDCRFVNLSSAAVYGNPENFPITENTLLRPVSPYGLHKKMAEDICSEFSKYFKIKTCSLRIFSAYGNGLRKQLFWDLYKKSKGSNKVELYGNGLESRDFVYVEDISNALDVIIKRADFISEPYNLATGREIRIRDAVENFYNILGWDGEVIFTGTHREGDPDNWCADIGKILSLGFEPVFGLSEGLSKYIEWLKEND